MRYMMMLFAFAVSTLAQESFRVENTNFTLSQASFIPGEDARYSYNYDRLRLYYDYREDAYFFHTSADAVHYLGKTFTHSETFDYLEALHADTPMRIQTAFQHYSSGASAAKLYRLYGGYQDDHNRLVAGVQNIAMGVGHIWTPSNLFNPKNSYALEPDETFGVLALSYTRYIGTASQLYGVLSSRKDHSAKYAAGMQTTIATTDIALNGIYSNDTKMLGYTIQGNLGDTGIAWRSEGAFIRGRIHTADSKIEEQNFFQGLVGADYGFAQGLTLSVEALYSSKIFDLDTYAVNINSELANNFTLSHFYLGTALSYDFTLYLSGSLLYIESFNDENSRFIAPSLSYIINDNNTLTLGAQLYGGAGESEFGRWKNSYFLKYVLSW